MDALRRLVRYGDVAAIALFIAAVAILVRSGYLYSIFVFIGIHALVALGLLLLVGFTGQVSLGHAGFFAFGAYTSAILSTKYGVNPWLAMLAAIAFGTVAGALIGLVTLRIKGHYLALATLAFGLIVQRLLLEFTSFTGGPVGLRDIPRLPLIAQSEQKDLLFFLLVWVIVLLVYVGVRNACRSPYGLLLKGVDSDETAVSVIGVKVFQLKLKILVFSTALAGLGGALYAHYVTFVSPEVFAVDRSILLLLMVVVGGSRYPLGAVIGAVILTFIPEYLRAYSDLSIGLYGLILMLILLYLPGGIASSWGVVGKILRRAGVRKRDALSDKAREVSATGTPPDRQGPGPEPRGDVGGSS